MALSLTAKNNELASTCFPIIQSIYTSVDKDNVKDVIRVIKWSSIHLDTTQYNQILSNALEAGSKAMVGFHNNRWKREDYEKLWLLKMHHLVQVENMDENSSWKVYKTVEEQRNEWKKEFICIIFSSLFKL